MRTVNDPLEFFACTEEFRSAGDRVGLVPTMGALHQGHFGLVEAAKRLCDRVCVSIFVNPLQFNNPADFDRYPRDLDADAAALEAMGVAAIFVPGVEDIHPAPINMRVATSGIVDRQEGAHRPGHFDGVATVVSKLFIAVGKSKVFFGEKDYQQTRVIADLIREFHFPVEMVVVPTVREADGLALSSRNRLLTRAARDAAPAMYAAFQAGRANAVQGSATAPVLASMRRLIEDRAAQTGAALAIDYLEAASGEDLRSLERFEAETRFFVAASYDGVRLIDNVAVFEK